MNPKEWRLRGRFFVMLATSLLVSLNAAAQDLLATGSIEGIVVDLDGTPVEGVEVTASTLRPQFGVVVMAVTNRGGEFSLRNVPAERVALSTQKREDGYYSTRELIFVSDENASAPTVAVGLGQTVRGVRLTLPARGGVLVGIVRDSATSERVPGAALMLQRDDRPDAAYSESLREDGRFILAVPNARFGLVITADGYLPWRSDDHVAAGFVQLQPGERQDLDVRLERVQP